LRTSVFFIEGHKQAEVFVFPFEKEIPMKNSIESFKKSALSTLTASLLGLGAMGLTAPLALADHHCACDAQCSKDCAEGKTESCGCKTYDCAKGKGCSHGKCKTHKSGEHKKD